MVTQSNISQIKSSHANPVLVRKNSNLKQTSIDLIRSIIGSTIIGLFIVKTGTSTSKKIKARLIGLVESSTIDKVSESLGLQVDSLKEVSLSSKILYRAKEFIGSDNTIVYVYETSDGFILDNGVDMLYGKN